MAGSRSFAGRRFHIKYNNSFFRNSEIMPTALIAEDENILRNELKESLSVLWPELEIIKETADGVSTLHAVKEFLPDVVFLDINMPHLSGLEVSTVIKDKTNIVFITAYGEHAVDAFDIGAVDYLLKPLNRGRLLNTI